MLAWERPGLPVLSNFAGPIEHFRAAVLEAWKNKVSADLCDGFRGGLFLDIPGTLQLLNSGHVPERDKALLRGVLAGGVWNDFLLEKVKGQHVPCRFCGGADNGGHLFWDCLFPLALPIVRHLFRFVARLFHVGFVEGLMVMVICFGNVPFFLSLKSVNILNSMISWGWISLVGLGAFYGMVGYFRSRG